MLNVQKMVVKRDRKVYYKTTTNRGKKIIMIVKTPGSQMGSPAALRTGFAAGVVYFDCFL